MNGSSKINAFLAEAGVFFMSTIEGDRPRSRPLGLHVEKDGKIFFGVGDFKPVYRQMLANPHVEIVACKGRDWLRMSGTAVFEKDLALAESVLEGSPLKNVYNEQTGKKLMMFHLEDGKAEFVSLMSVTETVEL